MSSEKKQVGRFIDEDLTMYEKVTADRCSFSGHQRDAVILCYCHPIISFAGVTVSGLSHKALQSHVMGLSLEDQSLDDSFKSWRVLSSIANRLIDPSCFRALVFPFAFQKVC